MYGHLTHNALQTSLITKKDLSATQVSRRRSLTGQARVKSQGNPCRICGRQRLRVLSVFPCLSFIPKPHCQSLFYNRRHIICQMKTSLNNTSKIKSPLWKLCTALSRKVETCPRPVMSSQITAIIICGNKMSTICNKWFLFQILLFAQHVSGTIMPIVRSSRVLYRWLLLVVFGALVFKLSVWCGAEGYVSGLRAAAATRTYNPHLQTIPKTCGLLQ
jgi:hypothetical protein